MPSNKKLPASTRAETGNAPVVTLGYGVGRSFSSVNKQAEAPAPLSSLPTPPNSISPVEEQSQDELTAAEALLELSQAASILKQQATVMENAARSLVQMAQDQAKPQMAHPVQRVRKPLPASRPQESQQHQPAQTAQNPQVQGTRSSGRKRNASSKKREADASAQVEETQRIQQRERKGAPKKRGAEDEM